MLSPEVLTYTHAHTSVPDMRKLLNSPKLVCIQVIARAPALIRNLSPEQFCV